MNLGGTRETGATGETSKICHLFSISPFTLFPHLAPNLSRLTN
jgi:hypothetical protein